MTHDHEKFATLLQEWAAAIVADDAEAIEEFVEHEWILVGEGGVMPRQRFLESVASGDLTHDTMTFDIHDVRIHRDVSVVVARSHTAGSFKGGPFRLEEWTTDVFVRRDQKWKCMLTHLSSVK